MIDKTTAKESGFGKKLRRDMKEKAKFTGKLHDPDDHWKPRAGDSASYLAGIEEKGAPRKRREANSLSSGKAWAKGAHERYKMGGGRNFNTR